MDVAARLSLPTLLLVLGLPAGCAPLSYPGARHFTDAEAAAFEPYVRCRNEAGHQW